MNRIRVEDDWLNGLYYGKRIVEFDDSLPEGRDVVKVLRYDYQCPDQDLYVIAAGIDKYMRTEVTP
jgi:hypothetical protein